MQINKGVGWEGGGDGRKSLAHIVNKLYFLWIYFFIFSTHTVDRVFKATLTITIPTNFDLMKKIYQNTADYSRFKNNAVSYLISEYLNIIYLARWSETEDSRGFIAMMMKFFRLLLFTL